MDVSKIEAPATALNSADREVAGTHRLNWSETRARLQVDRKRLMGSLPKTESVSMHPAFICVRLYRVSHWLFCSGHFLFARMAWQLNFLLTGADLSPAAELGEGLVILSPAGVTIQGRAGRNLTIMPCSGFGGEMGSFEDIGAGPGLPILQHDIVLEPHAAVLGPVRVGNRVRVRAGVILTKDAPDDSIVEAHPPRFFARGTTK